MADGVVEQDGGAVRSEADKGHPRLVGADPVPLRLHLPEEAVSPVSGAHPGHDVRVGLAGEDRLLRGKAHGSPQAAVVLIDVVPLVPPVGAQVQRGQIPGGNAAVPRRKAVNDAAGNGIGGQIFGLVVSMKHGNPLRSNR